MGPRRPPNGHVHSLVVRLTRSAKSIDRGRRKIYVPSHPLLLILESGPLNFGKTDSTDLDGVLSGYVRTYKGFYPYLVTYSVRGVIHSRFAVPKFVMVHEISSHFYLSSPTLGQGPCYFEDASVSCPHSGPSPPHPYPLFSSRDTRDPQCHSIDPGMDEIYVTTFERQWTYGRPSTMTSG